MHNGQSLSIIKVKNSFLQNKQMLSDFDSAKNESRCITEIDLTPEYPHTCVMDACNFSCLKTETGRQITEARRPCRHSAAAEAQVFPFDMH